MLLRNPIRRRVATFLVPPTTRKPNSPSYGRHARREPERSTASFLGRIAFASPSGFGKSRESFSPSWATATSFPQRRTPRLAPPQQSRRRSSSPNRRNAFKRNRTVGVSGTKARCRERELRDLLRPDFMNSNHLRPKEGRVMLLRRNQRTSPACSTA